VALQAKENSELPYRCENVSRIHKVRGVVFLIMTSAKGVLKIPAWRLRVEMVFGETQRSSDLG